MDIPPVPNQPESSVFPQGSFGVYGCKQGWQVANSPNLDKAYILSSFST